MSAIGNINTIFKRELKSFFQSPIAYVCVVIFLLILSALAFLFGGLIERGEASLTDSFFTFHPWIFMIVAPAVGMRLWSEEQREGTIELLLTMPVAAWQAIVGKYFAAAVVLFVAIFLTFPVAITINFLGDPDNGVIFSGYVGSYFLALSCLAESRFSSFPTRSDAATSPSLFLNSSKVPRFTLSSPSAPGSSKPRRPN